MKAPLTSPSIRVHFSSRLPVAKPTRFGSGASLVVTRRVARILRVVAAAIILGEDLIFVCIASTEPLFVRFFICHDPPSQVPADFAARQTLLPIRRVSTRPHGAVQQHEAHTHTTARGSHRWDRARETLKYVACNSHDAR
ncbi:unnamed protein product [Trichogramma brassicae]|uniref:Uncharacterized protein n=1 Tax=Trichogramma brassicae TaxID=86971 RepID=A0A6H5IMG6_9HYME|nr:unnamed protein product [Trichogramma brassicae]